MNSFQVADPGAILSHPFVNQSHCKSPAISGTIWELPTWQPMALSMAAWPGCSPADAEQSAGGGTWGSRLQTMFVGILGWPVDGELISESSVKLQGVKQQPQVTDG